MRRYWVASLLLGLALSLFLSASNASNGDRHPHFRRCVEGCEKTGHVKDAQLRSCVAHDHSTGPNVKKAALWKVFEEWDCQSECRYQCMKDTEARRELVKDAPMKYYGKWPFIRYFNLQEPASVVFSILNLLAHLEGLISYYRLLNCGLPQRALERGGKAHYYEYTGMWKIYAGFAINSWIWSAIFHARDVRITERLDYSSAVALLGYTLILTIIRVGSLKEEAAKVMVSAPIIAFISSHIMYLNFYDFDYGLNMKVCLAIGVTQLLLWTAWVGFSQHPARLKLWSVVLGTFLSVLLEIYDFPPAFGILDAHALWHAFTVPITIMWWHFIKEDARLRTFTLLKKYDVDGRKIQ